MLDVYRFFRSKLEETKESLIEKYIKIQREAPLKEAAEALIESSLDSGHVIKSWIEGGRKKEGFERYTSAFLTKGYAARKRGLFNKEFKNCYPKHIAMLEEEQLELEQLYEKIKAQILARKTHSFILIADLVMREYILIKEKRRAI